MTGDIVKIYTDGPREPDVDVVTIEGLGPSVEGDAGIGFLHSPYTPPTLASLRFSQQKHR